MSDRDAVLFANEAFYLAFAERDLDAMDSVWAEGVPVTCIHPGWDAIDDRDEIMQSWRAILVGSSPPDIQCRAPRVSFYGEMASVVCYEEIDGGYLIATNLFVREHGRWRMVHHQAAPTQGAPPDEEEADEGSSRGVVN
jgi:hypothetical protein